MTKRLLVDNGDGTHSVPLTRGYVAIIDSSDAESVGKHNWCATTSRGHRLVYASRAERLADGKLATVMMHRQLLGHPDHGYVDHRDGNSLNNRRGNLRICTNAENIRNARRRRDNTSGFKGVFFDKRKKSNPWFASIVVNYKNVFLGYFSSPEAAHAAYCKAAADLHGEFARTA